MVKKTPKNKFDDPAFRLQIVKWGATILFLFVVIHLIIIQFVQGEELSKKAYSRQMSNQIISPNRGTIYDAKGEILAQSIQVCYLIQIIKRFQMMLLLKECLKYLI